MVERFKVVAGAAIAASLLIAGSALAADMPAVRAPVAPAPFAPAPAFYDWSGVYAGLQGGYGWGTRDTAVPAFPPAGRTFDYRSNGWLLGGQLGANMQFDQLVVGAEGDLAWTGVDGTLGLTAAALPGPITAASESHEMKWLGTLRARLGVSLDEILLYGTGGVAFARIDGAAAFATPGGTVVASDSNTHRGWTVGGGMEAALTPNLSVKTEYLYVDLGSKTYSYAFAPSGPATTVSADHTQHVIRAGVNWRFSGF